MGFSIKPNLQAKDFFDRFPSFCCQPTIIVAVRNLSHYNSKRFFISDKIPNKLNGGDFLVRGQYLSSNNTCFKLYMASNGPLGLVNMLNGAILWMINTVNTNASRIEMQIGINI